MYYWNRDNFDGLAQLASALREHSELLLLAEYCRAREQGLRRQALASLDAFLDASAAWKAETARAACRTILELHARTPAAHQFLAQPLLVRFILPTLDEWTREVPDSQIAVRWLGILRRDPLLLERALVLAPGDVDVRRRLANWFLSHVDHATHHLVESRLLGELAATRQSLGDARRLVDTAPDSSLLADVAEEIAHYDALLRDWELFSRDPEASFPEWCVKRGRPYRWPAIFYYDR